MLQRIRGDYAHTIYASYLGYITQAIVNNFAPLLFLTFVEDFGLTLDQVTLITTLNFAVQLCVDFLSARVVDRVGYRACILAAHLFSVAGILGLAFFPAVLGGYAGVLTAVVLYAVGGGLIEVLVSPIVEACPTEKKEAAMSVLHAFYCWGHVGVVLLSTAFFAAFGVKNWRILACLWALIPLFNAFYYSQVPIYPIAAGHEKLSIGALCRQKVFWVLMVMMVCSGASEQGMSQWASAFAESGLQVEKAVGDLAGPCAFALLMGTSRAIYGRFSDRLPLRAAMMGSAVLCVVCYLLAALTGSAILSLVGCALCGFSVGIFWPGTFSLAAQALPGGGTAMYALMALAGDLGCSSGPTLVGLVANAANGQLTTGLLAAIVFPVVMIAVLVAFGRLKRKAG